MVSKSTIAKTAEGAGTFYAGCLNPFYRVCEHGRLKYYCKECGGNGYENATSYSVGFATMEKTRGTAKSVSWRGIYSAVFLTFRIELKNLK